MYGHFELENADKKGIEELYFFRCHISFQSSSGQTIYFLYYKVSNNVISH